MRAIFNVSSIARDKVTKTTTFFEEKGKPERNRAEVLLLTTRPNRLTDDESEGTLLTSVRLSTVTERPL